MGYTPAMSQDSQKNPPRRPILSLNKRGASLASADTPKSTLKLKPLKEDKEANSRKLCRSQPSSSEEFGNYRPSDQTATDLAEWLAQYSSVWHEFLPLNIGVIDEVYALLQLHGMEGQWSKRVIHKTLRWHTTRTAYWEGLLSCDDRYGLDGRNSGRVTPEQREHAKQQLDERIQAHKKRKGSNSSYTRKERE